MFAIDSIYKHLLTLCLLSTHQNEIEKRSVQGLQKTSLVYVKVPIKKVCVAGLLVCFPLHVWSVKPRDLDCHR